MWIWSHSLSLETVQLGLPVFGCASCLQIEPKSKTQNAESLRQWNDQFGCGERGARPQGKRLFSRKPNVDVAVLMVGVAPSRKEKGLQGLK